MLKVLIVISLFISEAKAQHSISEYFLQAPKQNSATLIRKNNQYHFNTEKWSLADNIALWPQLFGVENEKFWTGQKVSSIRLSGWWPIGTIAIGYLYAVRMEDENGNITSCVFVSSFNNETQRKGVDIDPFSQAPSPTGMRGKIVITQTVKITSEGRFTLVNKHQSPAKVLSKTVKYSIAEDGDVEME